MASFKHQGKVYPSHYINFTILRYPNYKIIRTKRVLLQTTKPYIQKQEKQDNKTTEKLIKI